MNNFADVDFPRFCTPCLASRRPPEQPQPVRPDSRRVKRRFFTITITIMFIIPVIPIILIVLIILIILIIIIIMIIFAVTDP